MSPSAFDNVLRTAYASLETQVRNAMDRARMNSAIRVFNTAVLAEGDGGMVSEKVRWPSVGLINTKCLTKKLYVHFGVLWVAHRDPVGIG